MLRVKAEEIKQKGGKMPMPTLVQNLMNGRNCSSVELWRATLGQLKIELQRLDGSTKRDEVFLREALEYSEAHARLEINAHEIGFEEVLTTPEWHAVDGLLIDVQVAADSVDRLFLQKFVLRLQEKGLEEQKADELSDPEIPNED